MCHRNIVGGGYVPRRVVNVDAFVTGTEADIGRRLRAGEVSGHIVAGISPGVASDLRGEVPGSLAKPPVCHRIVVEYRRHVVGTYRLGKDTYEGRSDNSQSQSRSRFHRKISR